MSKQILIYYLQQIGNNVILILCLLAVPALGITLLQ